MKKTLKKKWNFCLEWKKKKKKQKQQKSDNKLKRENA